LVTKANVVSTQCIQGLIDKGEAFEMIDGENLEFKGLMLKEAIGPTSQDKVIVVSVIGP
jgi:hypothetical protein